MTAKNIAIVRSAPALRPYIRHYVIIHPPDAAGGGVFLPYAGAIVSLFNERPLLVHGRSRGLVTTTEPTLFGPVSEPFTYARASPQTTRDVSVVFTPVGSAVLCGPVMHEIESGTAELEAFVNPADLAVLTERLYETRATSEVVRILDRFFLAAAMRRLTPADDPLLSALETVQSQPGHAGAMRYDVDALMHRLNMSSRHLQRLMLRATGMTPKRFLSVMRANHVVEYMTRAPETGLSEIASMFAYADQAHFARDFHRNTLVTPTDFRESQAHREHRSFMDIE
jgi:AraC-like DNA-binding protein